jgi:hypothetical protein
MEMTNYPAPVFIGLRRKVRCPRPSDWCNHPRAAPVVEICSVSNCIAGGPEVWLDGDGSGLHWTSEQGIDAWTATDAAKQAELRELGIEFFPGDRLCLCAYRIFPWVFGRAASPVVLETRQLFAADYPLPLPQPEWADYERLGYDVAQFEPVRLLDLDGESRAENSLVGGAYGCSPLSCNGLACIHPVNRYCLLDDIDTAVEVGRAFGREEPEPAPFVIIEVLRRRERVDRRNDCGPWHAQPISR